MSGVKSYTGCLVCGDGVMIKIKEGNAPRSACTGGQVEAHFSGGDITKISVGSGLSLPNGGDNGEVRIVLDATHSLPQNVRRRGRVAEWSGPAGGSVASTTTRRTRRAQGSIVGGKHVQRRARIPPSDKACSTPGQFARGFTRAATSSAPHRPRPGWPSGRCAVRSAGAIVLPKGEGVDLIIMPLPAGTYLITAVGTVGDRSGTALGDEEVHVRCSLRNGAFEPLPASESVVDIGEELFDDGPQASATVHGAVTLASPDSIRFTCMGLHGDSEPDEADDVVMTAVRIGTLTTP